MNNLKRMLIAATVGTSGMLLVAGVLFSYRVQAACTNPSSLPSGYAAPCPVLSLSASTVPQNGTLTLTAAPQAGTDYVYTTAYVYNGTAWAPYTLQGNNAYPNYSSAQASLALSSAQLSSLSLGTHYAVVWDWLWDATANCYKGPGLNQCNTGEWRLQEFTLTSAVTPSPTPTPSITPTPTPSATPSPTPSPTPIAGAMYYVDCSVASSGNGTSWGAAWKALSNITGLNPGDIVYISGSGVCSTYTTSQWNPINGTVGNPIIYRVGQDAGHTSPVTITLTGSPGMAGIGNALTGIYIDGNFGGAINMTLRGGIGASGNGTVWNGVRLSYLKMDNTEAGAGTARNTELDHNLIDLPPNSDNFWTQSQSAGLIGYTSNLIHDNIIHTRQYPGADPSCSGLYGVGDDGFQWIENTSFYNNVITTIYSTSQTLCQHQDFIQTAGSYMQIYNNYFENPGNYSTYGDFSGSASHWRVYNNVSVSTNTDPTGPTLQHFGIGFENVSGKTLNDFTIANNTCFSALANKVCVSLGAGAAGNNVTNSFVVNNLEWNSGDNNVPGTGGSITTSNEASGNPPASVTFVQNPTTGHYVPSYPIGNLHLQAGSTGAIGKGINPAPSYLTGFYATDKDGRTRTSPWDVGAYQF